jgi:hypothetical protein
VNDAPSFTIDGDVSMAADATVQSVAGWITAASAGPADESGQKLTYTISFVHEEDRALFDGAPLVHADGGLYFIPSGLEGTAELLITATDDGGTANGGQNKSAAQAFTITLTAPVGGEDPPSASGYLFVEDAEANEADGWMDFTVAYEDSEGEPAVLFWSTAPGDADANDFGMASGWLLFLPGDPAEQVLSIEINDDEVDEDDRQSFTLVVSSADESRTAVGTIVDNDDLPTVSVTFDDDPEAAPNEGGEVTFKISIEGATEREITVDYATEDGSAHGFDDYNGTGGTFTFAPNPDGKAHTPEEVTVTLRDDHAEEGDEDFTLRVVAVRNAQLGAEPAAAATVRDHTPKAHIEAVEGATEGSPVRMKAVLDRWSTSATTVHYMTYDGTADTTEYDYTGDGTVVVPAGYLEWEFTIGTYDDEELESTETFKVGIVGDSEDDAVEAQIYDDDEDDDDPDPNCCDEYDVIDESFDEFVEVFEPNWVDPTPEDPYDNEAPLIGWDHYQTIDITFDYECEECEDQYWYEDRTFIDFHAKVDENPPDTKNEGFAWIESIKSDDEDGAVDEDEGSITFTVRVGTHGNPSKFPTLTYKTGDGTATAGQDYVAHDKTIQLSAGDNTITININDDDRPEENEWFSVGSPTTSPNGLSSQLGVNSEGIGYVVTIRDDDGFSVSADDTVLAADDDDDDDNEVSDNLEDPSSSDINTDEYSTVTLSYGFSRTGSDVTGYHLAVTYDDTVSVWRNQSGTLTRIASGHSWELGPGSDAPTTVYVRGERGGPASVSFTVSGTAENECNKSDSVSFFVYQADLDVYSAGYSTQNAEESEDDDPISELTDGAFGFINDDDTDEDGQVDSSDSDVRPAVPEEGRLEQDLVKLVVHRPALPTEAPKNLSDKSNWLYLSLLEGAANLWAQPWKGAPLTLAAGGVLEINPWTIAEAGLVLWAELVDGAVPAMFALQIGAQPDKAKVEPVAKAMLDARTVQDNVDNETDFNHQSVFLSSTGGDDKTVYLPINDDDDDYDGVKDGKAKATPTLLDNDLLQIVIRNIGTLPEKAFFTLETPDTIRVWRKTDTGYTEVTKGEHLKPTELTPYKIELWIDAKADTGISSGTLTAKYHLDDTTKGVPAGSLKFKTFQISGPRYVPNNAKYEYSS